MNELMLAPKQKRITIKELKNYGTSLHPLYTIAVEITLIVEESPDALHQLFTGTGLIARETIPFDVVTNFRGSADNKPYYSARIVHDGIPKEYEVAARDTGRFLKTSITYEPMVHPEELRLTHPAEFSRSDIAVEEWELHNYKHYFMRLIASKRYESVDIQVKRGEEASDLSVITVASAESELRAKKAPCSWYLERLSVCNLEEDVRKELASE